jgi:hypothetical protein
LDGQECGNYQGADRNNQVAHVKENGIAPGPLSKVLYELDVSAANTLLLGLLDVDGLEHRFIAVFLGLSATGQG